MRYYFFNDSACRDGFENDCTADRSWQTASGLISVAAHEYYHVLVHLGIAPSQENQEKEEAAAYLLSSCVSKLILGDVENISAENTPGKGKPLLSGRDGSHEQRKTFNPIERAKESSLAGSAEAHEKLLQLDFDRSGSQREIIETLKLCAEGVKSSWRPY